MLLLDILLVGASNKRMPRMPFGWKVPTLSSKLSSMRIVPVYGLRRRSIKAPPQSDDTNRLSALFIQNNYRIN